MVLIVPLALLGLTLALRRVQGLDLGEAVVRAFLVAFAWVAVGTEVLSLLSALRPWPIFAGWAALSAAAGLLAWRAKPHAPPATPGLTAFELCVAASIALLLGIAAYVSWVAPPNTWDSMTYHMARVAAWIQNGTVAFFPTSISRQNHMPPLAEYAILHLQLLSGGDRYANFVQWSAYAVSLVLVGRLAREFGVSRAGQWLAALFAATLPVAVLQVSGTQNDLVEAAFVLAFAYHLLRMAIRFEHGDALFAALSLGFALLTKGTGYLYCGAVGVALGMRFVVSSDSGGGVTRRALLLAAIVAIAATINAGHYLRSQIAYGVPLASTRMHPLANGEISLAVLRANVLRNLALHLNSPSNRANAAIADAVTATLGEDANRPDATWPLTRFGDARFTLHENLAGNPLHLVLAFAAVAVVLARRKVPLGARPYAAALVAVALLYCLLLRWQPWGTRLHVAPYFLAAPLVAFMLRGERRLPAALVAGTVFAYALPFALMNETRPILAVRGAPIGDTPRLHQYFVSQPQLEDQVRAVVEVVERTRPDRVALLLHSDSWEYPFWVLMHKAAVALPPELRHVDGSASGDADTSAGLLIAEKPVAASHAHVLGREHLLETPSYLVLGPNRR